MELILTRQYHPKGVNGIIALNGKMICKTIELPWKLNLPRQSCIPEGKYLIRARHSQKFGKHLEILNVPNRQLILIHPANYALTELQGCIAPVLKTLGPGRGTFSRKALLKLLDLCKPYFTANQSVYLKSHHDYIRKI